MTLKENLESEGYLERLEGWPKKESSGLIIRCMAKANLNHPDEQPLLYIAEQDSIESVGISEEEARQKLRRAMNK